MRHSKYRQGNCIQREKENLIRSAELLDGFAAGFFHSIGRYSDARPFFPVQSVVNVLDIFQLSSGSFQYLVPLTVACSANPFSVN